MRKLRIPIFYLLITGTAFSGTRFEYEWIGFASPQSICESGRYLFISNLGSDDSETPDGYISMLTKQGQVIDKYWISDLTAPRGMNVINNRLYVADGGVIRGFNLRTRKEEFTLELPGTDTLYDIESLRDGASFAVSDAGTGLIYRVYFNGDYYSLVTDPIDGVRGLLYKSRNLYFCTSSSENGAPIGKIGYLRIKYSKRELIPYFLGEDTGRFRGITVHGGAVFVSDQGTDEIPGRIFCFDINENTSYTIWDQSLNGPGDFLIDGDNLWIPTEGDGKIKYITEIH